MNIRSKSGSIKTFLGLAVTVALFGVSLWVMLNRQFVVDQIAVSQYTPSAEIAQLATDAGLSDTGRFYFYASHPKLDGTSQFNAECKRTEKATAILGCNNGLQIFIYDVKDERLDGVREVTAAHETLHTIYLRLGDAEKKKIDALLKQEYTKLEKAGIGNLKERMAYYAKAEPGERDNELHSIIGTEIKDISSELETYYAKYFTDRQKVVAWHVKYSGKFDEISQDTSQLKAQLDALANAINTSTADYNKASIQLNADIEGFNARADKGDFTSRAQFDQERSALVARSDKLKAQRTSIDRQTVDYEAKRARYNSLVDESNSMQRSLDSSLAPAPSL